MREKKAGLPHTAVTAVMQNTKSALRHRENSAEGMPSFSHKNEYSAQRMLQNQSRSQAFKLKLPLNEKDGAHSHHGQTSEELGFSCSERNLRI